MRENLKFGQGISDSKIRRNPAILTSFVPNIEKIWRLYHYWHDCTKTFYIYSRLSVLILDGPPLFYKKLVVML